MINPDVGQQTYNVVSKVVGDSQTFVGDQLQLKITVQIENVGNVTLTTSVPKETDQQKINQIKESLVRSVQQSASQSHQIQKPFTEEILHEQLRNHTQIQSPDTEVDVAIKTLNIKPLESQLVLSDKEISTMRSLASRGTLAELEPYLTLENIAAFNRQSKTSLLHHASINRDNLDLFERVLQLAPTLESLSEGLEQTVLAYCMDSAPPKFVELLLKAHAEPNIRDRFGNTPLFLAIGLSDGPQKIKLLLEHNADPKLPHSGGATPLMRAEQLKRVEEVKILKAATEEFDRIWIKQKLIAHRFGLTDKVEIAGTKVELEGLNGNTTYPEMISSINNWRQNPSAIYSIPINEKGEPILTSKDFDDITHALKKAARKENITPDEINQGSLHAIQSGYGGHATSTVFGDEWVLKGNRGGSSGKEPGIRVFESENAENEEMAFWAAQVNKSGGTEQNNNFNNPELDKHIRLNADPLYIKHKDQQSGNCSWASAKLAFRSLLYVRFRQKGYDHLTSEQMSRVVYKSWTGDDRYRAFQEYINDPIMQKPAEELRQMGINKDQIVNSVFKKVISPRFAWIMEVMLNTTGVSPSARGKNFGITPLHVAVMTGNRNLVAQLIESGVNVKTTDLRAVNPLHIACAMNDLEMVKLLVPKSDINASDSKRLRPIDLACMNGNFPLAEYLISLEANVQKSGPNPSPLHYACSFGNPVLVQKLLEHDADVYARDEKGLTPLHIVSNNGDIGLARILIEKGANVNVNNNDGKSPFKIACEGGDLTLIDLMIDKGGADLKEGLQAASYAGNTKVAQHLIARGAK